MRRFQGLSLCFGFWGLKVIGLIFDVDGLIADTETVNARATAEIFKEEFGLTGVMREDFEDGVGKGAEAYVRAGASSHKKELTDNEVEKVTRLRQERFLKLLEAEPLDPFPGVLELMKGALAKLDEFRIAIATSSTREKSTAVLNSAAIPVDKMVYVCGDDVSNKKPDPELFLIASERLGIEPSSCVVFEDAPNGVAAAKAAGMVCVAVTNSVSREKLRGADLVVDSLAEISIEDLKQLLAS